MAGLAAGHLGKFAFAKQTAEGTAATTATYGLPRYSGGLVPIEARAPHEVTDSIAYRRGTYKQSSQVSGTVEVPSFVDAGGLLTLGVLPVDTVTGAGDPYSHALTHAVSRPWYTFWEARPLPDGTFIWDRFEDCRIKAVEYTFAAGQLVKQSVDIIGKKAVGNVSAPTITTTKTVDSTGPWHSTIGAVLKLDLDATPGATQIRNLTSGSVRIEFADEVMVQTDELTPRYNDPGLFSVGFNAETLIQDYQAYLATFFGSKTASAASPSTSIVTGALLFTFGVGAAADANRTLVIALPAMDFSLTPPAPNPGGQGLRASLVGPMTAPASGEPVTVTYKNAQSASYAA